MLYFNFFYWYYYNIIMKGGYTIKKLLLGFVTVLSLGLSFAPEKVSAAPLGEVTVLSSQEQDFTNSLTGTGSWGPVINKKYTTLTVRKGYTRTNTTKSVRKLGLLVARHTWRYSYRTY